MMNKPLQYDSLKAVLQYVEPNLRFQISYRCPSLQKTEKAVPLHIDSLKFENLKMCSGKACKVSVNSTDYLIGTIRIYPDEVETPSTHMRHNDEGGVGTDLDQFGLEDFSSESHLTPGDLKICKQLGMNSRWFENGGLVVIETELRELEARLAKLRNPKNRKNSSRNPQNSDEKLMKELENEIERMRISLLPYHHRRDNTPRGYDTIVQLTMKSKDCLRMIQQFPGKKIYQVEKRLNDFLFGNRKFISVKRLDLAKLSGVFRIPIGFGIKAQQLKCNHDEYQELEAISQFIHISSLQRLDLHSMWGKPQHIIIKSAKMLVLEFFGHNNMLAFLNQVANQILEVHTVSFSAEGYLELAKNFIETRRPIGTCYSFDAFKQMTNIKQYIIYELNGKQFGEGTFKVPIDEASELRITFEEMELTCRIKFEVIAV